MSALGKVLLYGYHRPVGLIRDSLRQGGPVAQWITERHRRAMEAAAENLPSLPEFAGTTPVTLHLMTGRRFWYQTLFCLHSFARAAQVTVQAELYDDGTIDTACAARLRRLGPRALFHERDDLRARLDRHLPAARFPVLRKRRSIYPNLRKLIDVHVGGTGWKLVLDSDLLFFRRPDLLLQWLAGPDRPLHMTDVQDAYGYSRALMETIAGRSIPRCLNVGLCGLRSDELDWTRLETWCCRLQEAEGTSYYQEQALVAMWLAGRECVVVPPDDYVLMPDDEEARRPHAVMHHYVHLSKRAYFRHAWRHLDFSSE